MRLLSALFFAGVLAVLPAAAQRRGASPQNPPQEASPDNSPDPQFGRRRNNDDPDMARIEHEQQKRMNEARQKALQKDTDHLLQLATELKQYVDRTNENILSVDVIRKAEEVEKLAKNIREKMKAQ